jgi:hypothetical protein
VCGDQARQLGDEELNEGVVLALGVVEDVSAVGGDIGADLFSVGFCTARILNGEAGNGDGPLSVFGVGGTARIGRARGFTGEIGSEQMGECGARGGIFGVHGCPPSVGFSSVLAFRGAVYTGETQRRKSLQNIHEKNAQRLAFFCVFGYNKSVYVRPVGVIWRTERGIDDGFSRDLGNKCPKNAVRIVKLHIFSEIELCMYPNIPELGGKSLILPLFCVIINGSMKRYALFAVFSGCLLAVHDRVRIRFGILVPLGVLFRLWDAPVYSRKTIFHEEEFSTMTKRLFALLLCLMMCASCFVGCTVEEKKEVVLTPEEEELLKGATINMHLSEMIYDFDPANAYNNEAALKIISLLYEPLFYLDEKGKVKSRLIDRYEISENEEEGEYKMTLHIAERAKWSDTNPISANDVVFSWKRVLEADASYPAAALLFDVRNAREANQGNTSIDNVGLSAPSEKVVEIFFEGKIDYDQFILNLTSYALAPLRENLATKTSYYEEVVDKDKEIIIIHRKYDDWAKKPATMAYSGPFRIRTIKYPDDPVKDKDGNIRLSAEGEYMYYRYAIDASDSMGMMLIRLEENN